MSDLSEKVLKLTSLYIGPASERFLERQTNSHMGGLKFADLKKEHLPELAKWVNVSAGLLIDKVKAQELSKKILSSA
jgi:hypothetical protein